MNIDTPSQGPAGTHNGEIVCSKTSPAIGFGDNFQGARIEEYDPVTDTWMRKASMTIGRYALSVSAGEKRLHLGYSGINWSKKSRFILKTR